MKKYLLIGLSVLLSNAGFSQINGDYSYSVAVRGYSLLQMPKVLNQKNRDNFTSSYLSGGMIKFNDNQISYRLGGSYISKDTQIVNNCATCQEVNGQMKDYNFSIGFEKSLNFSVIQPYFAFDLGFRYNKFDGTLISTSILDENTATPVRPDGVETSKTGFTMAPVFGIKINPIDKLTIFLESSLQWFHAYERQEVVAADANNTITLNKYNKSEFLLNPVSVGIQFNFGSNR